MKILLKGKTKWELDLLIRKHFLELSNFVEEKLKYFDRKHNSLNVETTNDEFQNTGGALFSKIRQI